MTMRSTREQMIVEAEAAAEFRAANPDWKAPRFEDPYEAVEQIARTVPYLSPSTLAKATGDRAAIGKHPMRRAA